MRAPISILSTLLFAGCAHAGAEPTLSEATVDIDWLEHRASEFTRFAFNPFEQEISGPALMGMKYAGLIERLGQPVDRERSEVTDRSGVLTNTQVVLHYHDFSVAVVDYGLGLNRSAIQDLAITGNSQKMKYGLLIGESSRRDVLSTFPSDELSPTGSGLYMLVPAIERDDRFEPAVTYMTIRFFFDKHGVLTKVRIDQPFED